uniref:Uncharacterized protein n=1 Tax=Homalodisca liturata TaxID=320908 RepID=A0A1B6HJJ4_9HEMI
MARTGSFHLAALIFLSFVLRYEGNCLPPQPIEVEIGTWNTSSMHNVLLDSENWWKDILKSRENEDKLKEYERTSPNISNKNKNTEHRESESEATHKNAHGTEKMKGPRKQSVTITDVSIHNPETLTTRKIKSTPKGETSIVKNENQNKTKCGCKDKECSHNTAQESGICNLFACLMLLACSFYRYHVF